MSKQSDQIEAYWQKLLGQARVGLIGASDEEIKVQLFEVLEEFFSDSNCWMETIKIVVIPDTQDYPVQPSTGRILRLDGVLDQNNVKQSAIMPEIGVVRFQYPYSQTQPMTVMVVKTLTDPFLCFPPHIPDWILPLHGLKLLWGILGNMMMQSGMSYSNPQLGQYYLKRFWDGVVGAGVAAIKANTVSAQPWMFPQQFRTYGQRGGVSTYNVHPTPR